MRSSSKKRLATAVILIILLTGLCLYYQENYQKHTNYPDTTMILAHYPLGEYVSVSGDVTSVYTGGFNLKDTGFNQKVIYTVESSTSVSVGDNVGVMGVLEPSYHVKEYKIIVIPKWSYQFMLIRSFLAVLFLAWLFNRYWYFNPKKMEFRRRK